ncbi:MAG: TetR/AcrR family transcriptional regulator [Sphingosinicella sp.]|nr:TetR/AcrR family transcriptional regulator [Sphingosinicella sp.]
MPRLWTDTIDAHRQAVRDAVVSTTSILVRENGLASVTMSQIAEQSGIGRATLYKYYPNLEAILAAWHQRHVADHIEHLAQLGRTSDDLAHRLEAVVGAYARIAFRRGREGGDAAAMIHQGEHVARAHDQLNDLFQKLLADAARAGAVRRDIPVDELANYTIHALTAAEKLTSEASVQRLVQVTLETLKQQC